MNRAAKRVSKGYTLVEMALVLVIAGVAFGAILQGREMVENSRIKSIINDFEHITQSYYAYIKRAGHPPGVRRNAAGDITRESLRTTEFFRDLIAEGFVFEIDPDSPTGFVTNIYGQNWTVRSLGGIYNSFNAPQLCTGGLPLFVARAIDQKLDDGDPSTGRVMTRYNSTYLTTYEEGTALTDRDFFVTCRRL